MKEIIIKVAVKQLLMRVPFLASGPLGWIASILLTKLLNVVLTETIIGIKMAAIELEVNGEVKDYKKALEKGNHEEIIAAAGKLIDFN